MDFQGLPVDPSVGPQGGGRYGIGRIQTGDGLVHFISTLV
jgi:hypothetical protein